MKKKFTLSLPKCIFLLIVCNFLCKCVQSQNMQLNFLGYSSGHYVISITNRQTCNADTRINYLQGGLPADTTINIASGATITVILTSDYSPGSEIKIKSDGQCSSNGWVSITVPGQLLPIKLTSFTAKKVNASVLLNWQADDVSAIEVQRSADARNYQKLYTVSGSQFLDFIPNDEDNFYRLKLFSTSGSFIYSPVERVSFHASTSIAGIYNFSGQKIANHISAAPRGYFIVRYSNGITKQFVK